MKIALVAFDPRVKIFWVKMSPGSKCLGSKCLLKSLGSKCLGVKVPLGSKCPGVKVSLGSKCPWGQSVFGVKMSVGSKCLWGQNGCEPAKHFVFSQLR